MVVRNDINGRRAKRYYGSTSMELSKTLEKLSSGYRINRSADDAAGLAISEKMRLQITGLGRARENSQDGVKLIQTGEGALQEVQDMLDRAEYLAVQSANGTYMDELDRENLQKELAHLRSEIDRITTSANFNGIELFQDYGAAYERSTFAPDPAAMEYQKKLETLKKSENLVSQRLKTENTRQQAENTVSNASSGSAQKQPALSSNKKLDTLLEDQEKGDLNIVYIRDDAVSTTQTPIGTATSPSSYMVTENGVQKDLGDILKKEIIPNIVTNILKSYDAFSYLSGSSIGIGLEYFHGNGTAQESTLAYVEIGSAVWSNNQVAYLTYKLGVNLDTIGSWNSSTREDLEATIAHEMIHAFMDEATTSGMLGRPVDPTTGLPSGKDESEKFPGWFREGMAQTASGHNNWIHPNASTGLKLTASSTDAEIKAQIQDATKQLGSDTTSSRYGTGYLACMYLGAVIAGNGQPSGTIDAATISSGLNKLLREVIGGSSLNDAIKTLTNGTFSSMADFETKFNSVDSAPGLCSFTRGLLSAAGSGRGGLVSGNLTDSDLAANVELSGVKLFELNTQNNSIKNEYPSDYPILSGGTVNKPGVAPSDFNTPAPPPADYGDYSVSGTDLSGVSYDSTTGILTVDGGSNVTITLNAGVTTTAQGIVLKGTGTVTLDGVTMTGTVDVQNPNTKVAVSGNNNIGTLAMSANATTDFTGSGKLNINSIAGDNSNAIKSDGVDVTVGSGDINLKSLDIKNGDFSGPGKVDADSLAVENGTLTAAGDIAATDLSISNGTVIANDGNGTITGNISVNGAAVAVGDISSATLAGSTYKDIDIPFQTGTNNISVLDDLASITINGTTFDAPIKKDAPNANLLLNNSSDHKVTFTDSNNSSKTLMATRVNGTDGVTFDHFTWGLPPRPFTVKKADGSAAVEGQDFEYDADGTTLILKNAGELTISGGVNNDDPANPIKGRIKLEDGIQGSVKLNLDGCTVDIADGCAFDLGTDNDVVLTLVDGKTNTFKSGSNYAGIAVGTGTALTITGTNDGELNVTGGTNAAGIGANYDTNLKDAAATGNSITINGGHIIATGGKYAAGIGAGYQTAFGDIEINGGNIWARGNSMSAGIGGGYHGNIHNIKITDCDKIDAYASAGVGIGTGTNAAGGDIIISGGKDITAKGGSAAAGIGPDLNGSMGKIEISGGNITAVSGTQGAAIGAGPSAHVTSISISESTGTTTIKATGGTNGVGIGTGFNGSTCGSILITGGTIWAEGSQNSTGIGAGRDSTCGSITIGDENNSDSKIIVTAKGGMTSNGGNIMSYDDKGHTQAGTVKIFGDNTSVRPGNEGEGLYSTSGVEDNTGNERYSYPLYLFNVDTGSEPLAAGVGVDTAPPGLLPLDHTKVQPGSITISSSAGDSWTQGLSHSPDDNNYVFLWLKPEDQTLTITYEEDGTPKTMTVDLIYYPKSGVFRTATQPVPSVPKPPGYIDDGPVTPGKPGDQPDTPDTPNQPDTPVSPPPTEGAMGGIILQIGANYGEILEVPRFYLSVRALGLDTISIATQERAQKAMGVLRDAINRVSYIRGDYGALQNRLEHNINDLGQARENISDAESRIRDADMAEEYTKFLKLNILQQSAQAMMAHSNEDANRVLQLLQ